MRTTSLLLVAALAAISYAQEEPTAAEVKAANQAKVNIAE